MAQIDKLIESLEDDDEHELQIIINHGIPKLRTIAELLLDTIDLCNRITSDVPLENEYLICDDDRRDFAEIYLKYLEYIIDLGKLFNLDEVRESENFTVTANINYEDIIKWNTIFQQEMQEYAMLIYLFWTSELIKTKIEK